MLMNEEKDNQVKDVVNNLLSLFPLLSRSLKGMREDTNMNKGDIMVLVALHKHKKMTMSELGNRLSLVKPHVTLHINKLVKKKLVERSSDENDRRIIYISLTTKGEEEIKNMYESLSSNLGKIVETFDPEQINEFNTSLINVRKTLNQIIEIKDKTK